MSKGRGCPVGSSPNEAGGGEHNLFQEQSSSSHVTMCHLDQDQLCPNLLGIHLLLSLGMTQRRAGRLDIAGSWSPRH